MYVHTLVMRDGSEQDFTSHRQDPMHELASAPVTTLGAKQVPVVFLTLTRPRDSRTDVQSFAVSVESIALVKEGEQQ